MITTWGASFVSTCRRELRQQHRWFASSSTTKAPVPREDLPIPEKEDSARPALAQNYESPWGLSSLEVCFIPARVC